MVLTRAVVRFTSLHRLELIEAPNCLEVQNMTALQELILIDSTDASLSILAPGALRDLRRLHVEESQRYRQDSETGPDHTESEKAKYISFGNAIQSLPNLEQLSGRCQLFEWGWGLDTILQHWHEGNYAGHEMTAFSRYPSLEIGLWQKP